MKFAYWKILIYSYIFLRKYEQKLTLLVRKIKKETENTKITYFELYRWYGERKKTESVNATASTSIVTMDNDLQSRHL